MPPEGGGIAVPSPIFFAARFVSKNIQSPVDEFSDTDQFLSAWLELGDIATEPPEAAWKDRAPSRQR